VFGNSAINKILMKNLQKATDEQLTGLSIKNPDNFGILISRYWKCLFRYVRRISYFEKEDIEDILQETFIKVYKNINSFDNSLKFSTWIYQITRNTVIDAIRKKSVRPQSAGLENDDLMKIIKSNESPEKDIIFKEDLEKIKEVISELPIKYREVLVLRFLEEKTYEEMVDILKKPKGTVASLVNRGKKMVASEIGIKD